MSLRKTTVGFVVILAVSGALCGAAFSSGAGTRTAANVARTWNCKTNPVDVEAAVQIRASATKVSVSTGDPGSPEAFISFSTTKQRYTVGGRCRAVSKRVVMSRNGLTASHSSLVECASPGHVWIRLVLGLDYYDLPESAKIEVTQPHAKLKPLAHVVWSPDASTTYYRQAACSAH